MLKGFREFLLRGNVVDLAIAVVIGTAFTALVTSVVANLVNPLIAAVGGNNVDGLAHRLVRDNPKSVLDLGAVIAAVVNFVLIGAVVYVALVVPMRRLTALRERSARQGTGEGRAVADPAVAPTEDVLLLREIRDLLVAGRPTAGSTPPSAQEVG